MDEMRPFNSYSVDLTFNAGAGIKTIFNVSKDWTR